MDQGQPTMSTVGRLNGTNALVTGGGAGIGLAASLALARQGATVVVADIDIAAAERAANRIIEEGGSASAALVDITSTSSMEAMFEAVGSELGALNLLFSHAGVQGTSGFDISDEQFDHVLHANLRSHFVATRCAVELMRPCAPRASIVYTSSTAALRPNARAPLYAASKAGILSLMRSVAAEYGPIGIRANAICPGPTETRFSREFAFSGGTDEDAYNEMLLAAGRRIPLGRVGQAADVAAAVAFLASEEAAYLNGVVLPVDGGLTA